MGVIPQQRSFLQASITPTSPFPQQAVPASLWPCLLCFSHSPPEDTVFRGTRFHHISAPMPRPHSPAASSQTAQCGAIADTQGLNFSPVALLKEKKLVSITDRKGAPHQETSSTGRTLKQTSPGALGSLPAPFFWSRPSSCNWPLPPRALRVSQKSKERNLVSKH